jgi:hypothetical protein
LEPPPSWSRGEGAIEAARLEGKCMWRSGWIHREEERRLARAAMEWGAAAVEWGEKGHSHSDGEEAVCGGGPHSNDTE